MEDLVIPTAQASPDNRYNTAWWVGLNGVCDSWMHDGVTYSYGSPDAATSYAYAVLRTDEFYNINYVLLSSYGTIHIPLRARSITILMLVVSP